MNRPDDEQLYNKISNKDKEIIHRLEQEISNLLIRHSGKWYEVEEELSVLDSQIERIKNQYKNQLSKNNIQNKTNFIDLNNNNQVWKKLRDKIGNYEVEQTKYTKILSNKLLSDNNYTKEDFKKDFEEWEKKNENILNNIANDLNKILNKFNLELKMDDNTKSYEELIIKDLSNKEEIKYEDLSTGSKSLISTFIPLKSYKPKDSIILIDEPENSFYPDIQRQLVELYMGVGENNQLIVATHSPLIASSFEPWEVVELKFDKNSQIYREKYYEGENRVENYTIDPRMLTWTGILTDIFDLKEDSNFTYREKKLMEYANLKAEIKAIQDKNEKKKKFEELQKLSKKLGLYNQ